MKDETPLVDLMIAYQRGDLAAFEELYAMLAVDVRRYLSRVHSDRTVVSDLLQDTFLELHRARITYTPPLPVRPWVYGIARNVSARSRRAASLAPNVEASEAEVELIAVPISEMSLVDALDAQSAINTLPRNVGEPWLLHHVFGFSFDAIATRLGITPMAAKLRSSRATKALRLALTGGRRRKR